MITLLAQIVDKLKRSLSFADVHDHRLQVWLQLLSNNAFNELLFLQCFGLDSDVVLLNFNVERLGEEQFVEVVDELVRLVLLEA